MNVNLVKLKEKAAQCMNELSEKVGDGEPTKLDAHISAILAAIITMDLKSVTAPEGIQWHNIKTDPPKKRGQYLVVIEDDVDNVVFADVENYFKKGDYITTKVSQKPTIAERLYEDLFTDNNNVYAEKDGFYVLHTHEFNATYDRVINENPLYDVYWAELPAAPNGKDWGVIGHGKDD